MISPLLPQLGPDPQGGPGPAGPGLDLRVEPDQDAYGCITTPPGAHTDDFWTQAFHDSLPWLSWKLKLTPQPQSIPAQCVAGKS